MSISAENRSEFLEKLVRCRSQVPTGALSQPILSTPGPFRIVLGNWAFSSTKPSHLQIMNTDGLQATVLKEDLPGFIFESNRGTKHSFTAETALGPEFAQGWASKRSKKFKSKAEALKQKVGFTRFFRGHIWKLIQSEAHKFLSWLLF